MIPTYFRDIISEVQREVSSMYNEGSPAHNFERKKKNMSRRGHRLRLRREGKFYDFDDKGGDNHPTPPMRPPIGFKAAEVKVSNGKDWKKKKKLKKLRKKGLKLLKDWEALGKLILKEVNNEQDLKAQ